MLPLRSTVRSKSVLICMPDPKRKRRLLVQPDPTPFDVAQDAARRNVNPALAVAIAKQESRGKGNAVSPKGALGTMQVMPATGRQMAAKLGERYDPRDKAQNVRLGNTYLAELQDQFGDDPVKVLAGYNAGPGAVKKYGGVPPYKETREYVRKVTDTVTKLGSFGGGQTGDQAGGSGRATDALALVPRTAKPKPEPPGIRMSGAEMAHLNWPQYQAELAGQRELGTTMPERQMPGTGTPQIADYAELDGQRVPILKVQEPAGRVSASFAGQVQNAPRGSVAERDPVQVTIPESMEDALVSGQNRQLVQLDAARLRSAKDPELELLRQYGEQIGVGDALAEMHARGLVFGGVPDALGRELQQVLSQPDQAMKALVSEENLPLAKAYQQGGLASAIRRFEAMYGRKPVGWEQMAAQLRRDPSFTERAYNPDENALLQELQAEEDRRAVAGGSFGQDVTAGAAREGEAITRMLLNADRLNPLTGFGTLNAETRQRLEGILGENRDLLDRYERAADSMQSRVTRGIASGAASLPRYAVAALLAPQTLLGQAAAAGLATGAAEDWSDPQAALTRTALGTVMGGGGYAANKLARQGAEQLAENVFQKAAPAVGDDLAQFGAEVTGTLANIGARTAGGAGVGAGASYLAGERDPQRLAENALIASVLANLTGPRVEVRGNLPFSEQAALPSGAPRLNSPSGDAGQPTVTPEAVRTVRGLLTQRVGEAQQQSAQNQQDVSRGLVPTYPDAELRLRELGEQTAMLESAAPASENIVSEQPGSPAGTPTVTQPPAGPRFKDSREARRELGKVERVFGKDSPEADLLRGRVAELERSEAEKLLKQFPDYQPKPKERTVEDRLRELGTQIKSLGLHTTPEHADRINALSTELQRELGLTEKEVNRRAVRLLTGLGDRETRRREDGEAKADQTVEPAVPEEPQWKRLQREIETRQAAEAETRAQELAARQERLQEQLRQENEEMALRVEEERRRIAFDQYNRFGSEPVPDVQAQRETRLGNRRLSRFVTDLGGIRPSVANQGELDLLKVREGGQIGIVNQNGTPADLLRVQAEEAGYGPFADEQEFIRQVVEDTYVQQESRSRTWLPPPQADDEPLADEAELAAKFTTLMQSRAGARAYNRVFQGDTSDEAINELRSVARQLGFSNDESDDLLAEFRPAGAGGRDVRALADAPANEPETAGALSPVARYARGREFGNLRELNDEQVAARVDDLTRLIYDRQGEVSDEIWEEYGLLRARERETAKAQEERAQAEARKTPGSFEAQMPERANEPVPVRFPVPAVLKRSPQEVSDDEFDSYLKELDAVFAETVTGDLSQDDLVARLAKSLVIEASRERAQRVRAGRLEAKHQPGQSRTIPKKERTKAMQQQLAAMKAQQQTGTPAPVPESAETVAAQMDALLAGRRRAVLLTPGTPTPALPEGVRRVKTAVGEFLALKSLPAKRIRRMVRAGTYHKLLGLIEPKSERTSQVVVARTAEGAEAQTAMVSPERTSEQQAVFEKMYPNATVETGGAELGAEVIRERQRSQIEQAAHEAATSPQNDLPEPTDGQRDAGNYQLGHVKLHGFDISVEYPKGSTRRGTSKSGQEWQVEVANHYGYIRRTEGADGEQVDAFIGPNPDSERVFVVDQVDADSKRFDEHKVILGVNSLVEATRLYDAHFDDGRGPDRRGAMTEMSVTEFKNWLKDGDTTKPVAESDIPDFSALSVNSIARQPHWKPFYAGIWSPEKSPDRSIRPQDLPLFRGTGRGDAISTLRPMEGGELGGGVYLTPQPEIAASYGGYPGATVKSGGRAVHQYKLARTINPMEIGYLSGASDYGGTGTLTDGTGRQIWQGTISDDQSSSVVAETARLAGLKLLIGLDESLAFNQVSILDLTLLEPVRTYQQPLTQTLKNSLNQELVTKIVSLKKMLKTSPGDNRLQTQLAMYRQAQTALQRELVAPQNTEEPFPQLTVSTSIPDAAMPELRTKPKSAGNQNSAQKDNPPVVSDLAGNEAETKARTAKEPWQITQDQYVQARDRAYIVKRGGHIPSHVSLGIQQDASRRHERLVKNALAEGKPVPPEVLADYAELQKTESVTEPAPDLSDAPATGQVASMSAQSSSTPTAPERRKGKRNVNATPTLWANAPETSGDNPAATLSTTETDGDTTAGTPESTDSGLRPVRNADRTGTRSARSADAGVTPVYSDRPAETAGNVGERTGRTEPDGSGRETADLTDSGRAPEQTPSAAHRPASYRITDDADLIPRGEKDRAKRNLEAIRLLRQLQHEGRQATADEQQTLARYTGWGALPAVFNDLNEAGASWNDLRAELQHLLTPEEYEAAKKSTLNAHFTSPQMIRTMWQMVTRLGFKGGRVLEPSMGIGSFIGLMPEGIKAKVTGVELDRITGQMADHLYPDSNVRVQDFADFHPPDGFFDLVIGNVPFGNFPLTDATYKKQRRDAGDQATVTALSKANIHDVFLLKSLDKLRPGGLLTIITSTGTMDKAENAIRHAVDKKAVLVAALRLPDGAFGKNAGTQVVTDLLIFQKRVPGSEQPVTHHPFVGLSELPDPDGGEAISVNEYFAKYPEDILGRLDRKSRLYRGDAMHVTMTDDFEERLAQALGNLPENVLTSAGKVERQGEVTYATEADGAPYTFSMKHGKVRYRDGLTVAEVSFDKPEDAARVKGMIEIRDAARALLEAQLRGAPNDDLSEGRWKLNQLYDQFVKQYKPLRSRTNAALFADDVTGPFLLSLESGYDKGKATKSDIFRRNTVSRQETPERAQTASEAMAISLFQHGEPRLEAIAKLLGVGEDDALKRLAADSLAFENPHGGLETADEYLSGNVRRKLSLARAAAELDGKYQRNVDALSAVQPKDIDYVDITAKPGANWIPASDYENFAASLLGVEPGAVSLLYLPTNSSWTVREISAAARSSVAASQKYGTERVPFHKILEAAFNDEVIKVYDQIDRDTRLYNKEESEKAMNKVQDIRDAFQDWIWNDAERATRLHRYYNDNFNNIRLTEYAGNHYRNADGKFVLPGMNPLIELRPNQVKDIWQAIVNGKLLDASEVGAGKSYILTAIAMEWRRLGQHRKPAIVMPKSLISDFVKNARALYPNAKIYTTDDNFDGANRRRAVAQIATGDHDIVIMTHEHMDYLPMRPEVVQAFIQRELDEVEEHLRDAIADQSDEDRKKGGNRVVKRLEAQLEKLNQRLKESIEDTKRDDGLYFEDTGIDALLIDEAHVYKSLPVYTRRENIKGIPTSASKRASNLLMRSRWLMEMNHGRGLVLATGTPIANTMAELYNMQRYLQFRELEERGIDRFDAWVDTFASVSTRLERTLSGDYKPTSRLAEFVNLPELLQLTRQVMATNFVDEMPWVKRPTRQDFVHVAPMSKEQETFLQEARARAEALRKLSPRERREARDNFLSISTDLRKSALSTGLVRAGVASDGKVQMMVQEVVRIAREHSDKTQMIFADLGINKTAWGYSVYHEVIDALVAGGIPRNQIINFATVSDGARGEAIRRLYEGEARIGIGSSGKMGTGVNAQKNLIALHHLDAPWLPALVEQRNGRGWRQGNLNEEIQIHTYTTENSFDELMWQSLSRKQNFIRQAMRGSTERVVKDEETGDEDTGELSFDAIMAATSGNPFEAGRVNAQEKLDRLVRAEKNHRSQLARYRHTIEQSQRYIPRLEADIEEALKDQQLYEQHKGDFVVTLRDKQYNKRESAGAAILSILMILPEGRTTGVGSFRGFDLLMKRSGEASYRGWLRSPVTEREYEFNLNVETPAGMFLSAESKLRGFGDDVERARREIARQQQQIADAERALTEPFRRQADLDRARISLEEVTQKSIEFEQKKKAGIERERLSGQKRPATPQVTELREGQMKAEKLSRPRNRRAEAGILVPLTSADLKAGARRLLLGRTRTEMPHGFDPATWFQQVQQEAQARGASAQTLSELMGMLADGYQAAQRGDYDELLLSRLRISRKLKKLKTLGTGEYLTNLRRANVLSSLSVIGRNIASNAGAILANEISKPAATLVDRWVSKKYGTPRTVSAPTPAELLYASQAAILKGLPEALQTLVYGTSESQLDLRAADPEGKYHYQEVQPLKFLPGLDKYINLTLRAMGAADRPFFAFVYAESYYNQARLAVQSLPEPRRAAALQHLLRRPDPTMQAIATAEAEYVTFARANELSDLYRKGLTHLKNYREDAERAWGARKAAGLLAFALENVILFDRVPTNVLLSAIDYTGLSAPVKIKNFLAKHQTATGGNGAQPPSVTGGAGGAAAVPLPPTPQEQAAFAQGLGRSLTGLFAFLVGGALLAYLGLATGEEDERQGVRDLKRAAGIEPNSVTMGDTQVPVGRVAGPGGQALTIGASLQEATQTRAGEETQTARQRIATKGKRVLRVAGKQLEDLPLAAGAVTLGKGLGQFLTSGKSAELERFGRGVAGSFVPAPLKEYAERQDRDEQGRVRSRVQSESLLDAAKARIPGQRETLPLRRNVLGEPETQPAPENFLRTRPAAKLTPGVKEAIRLGVGFAPPDRKMSESRQAARGAALRKALDEAVRLPGYQAASDEVKASVLDRYADFRRDDEDPQRATTGQETVSATFRQLRLAQMVQIETGLADMQRLPGWTKLTEEQQKAAVKMYRAAFNTGARGNAGTARAKEQAEKLPQLVTPLDVQRAQIEAVLGAVRGR